MSSPPQSQGSDGKSYNLPIVYCRVHCKKKEEYFILAVSKNDKGIKVKLWEC
jgi:hypothetical protein